MSRISDLFHSVFAREVAETYSTRLLLALMSVGISVITARILGPSGRGAYAAAMAAAAIGVQFGNLGLHSAGTYYVGQNRESLPSLVGNSLAVSFGAAGALVAIAGVAFDLLPGFAPATGSLLSLTLISIPVSLAYLLLQNLLIGIRDLRAFNGIEIATRVFLLGWICALAMLGRVSVEGVFGATVASGGIGFSFALWRLIGHSVDRPSTSFALLRRGLHYGFKAYLASLFAFLLLRVDILMVRGMLGAESSGYYAVAVNIADMLYLLPSTIGIVLFPKLAALKDNHAKWSTARQVFLIVLGVMLGLAIGTIAVAGALVHLLFGGSFLPATPAVQILAGGMVFYGANNVLSICLAAMAFPWFAVWVWAVGAAVNVLLNLIWIPSFGICGAAAASFSAYALVFLLQLSYLSRASR